jgi:hypothetical protein
LTGGALSLALLASGCATLSESQCTAGDWETVGFADGLSGTASSQLLKHQNACMKHGIVPDRDAYLAGWDAGIVEYCEPGNGFAVGQRGERFGNLCPSHLQDAFYAAYQDGRQLYLAQREIDQLARQVSQKEYRLRQVGAELQRTDVELIAADTSTERRVELLAQSKALSEEQGTLEAEIHSLEGQIARKSEQLDSLRNALAFVAY